uniref:Uncharacterized protein n=1 Tax=viral metagenome TaxID=1070528 RepID=A0A6M3Y0E2_9ZZZZ
MAEERHTPGPWEISRDAVPAGFVQVTVYEERTGRRVATAFKEEANARLISAAPGLLEACKLCAQALQDHVQYDDGESLERDGYNAAVAAIAKAQAD